jgi:pyrrolysine biosynthesis protein PylD
VTRLVEDDVRALTAHLDEVERRLVALTGCDFVALAARACGASGGVARDALAHAAVAVVPITSGEGVIPGFVECVAAICARLGCRARVTQATDVSGFGEALTAGDDLVFAADDRTFLAFELTRRVVADDDSCTAHAYVAALDAAAGPGGLAGRSVLLIGLGPVGRAAAARLVALDADVLVCERDEARLAAVVRELPRVTPVTLADGLARSRLVLDATPTPDLIDAGWVGADGIVSCPGLPPGVTAAAARALGERLVHEPLALGVAAMAVEALTRCRPPLRPPGATPFAGW